MSAEVLPPQSSTTDSAETIKPRGKRWGTISFYGGTMIGVGVLTTCVAMLWQNINDRKVEAQQHAFRVVELNNDMIDPAEWGKNYPRQYEMYLQTAEIQATKYGGSVNYQKMDKFPVYRTLFKGY